MTTHTYFDLFAFIKSIASVEIAASAAQSTAWKVDTMIIGASRQLFKDIRDDQFGAGIDGRAELTNMLNEQAYAEKSFEEIGSSVTGPVSTIKELNYQREAWHALAGELTPLTCDYKGVPRTYVEKTIEDQIFAPNAIKVNADTTRKLQINAKRFAAAYDMPEEADGLFKRKLERAQAQADKTSDNIKTMAQGVAHMYSLALAYSGDMPDLNTDANFQSLTIDSRRALLDNCIRAIERTVDQAAGDSNMRDSDYDLMCLSGIKAVKEIKQVLNSPTFKAHAQQLAAAETNLG